MRSNIISHNGICPLSLIPSQHGVLLYFIWKHNIKIIKSHFVLAVTAGSTGISMSWLSEKHIAWPGSEAPATLRLNKDQK